MKIAVMSRGNTKESLVSDEFGRAPFIIIYDTKNSLYEAIENTGAIIIDGSGPEAAKLIIGNRIDLLLTKEIGVKAYSVLAEAHIAIELLTSASTVNSSIKHILNNIKGSRGVYSD